MSKWVFITNAVAAILIIIAYSVLTALHDDGSALLGLLGGQGLAAAIGKGVQIANGSLTRT